jgi:hypothetical protein
MPKWSGHQPPHTCGYHTLPYVSLLHVVHGHPMLWSPYYTVYGYQLFGLTPKQPNLFILFTPTHIIHYAYIYFFFGFKELEYNIITSIEYNIFYFLIYSL